MMTQDGPHIDALSTRNLRTPLLSEYFGSTMQRDDIRDVAEEVMRRYLAKVPKETGNLASTAKVTSRRDPHEHDNRWVADFEIGGPRAPYAEAVDAEHGILDSVLAEMGYRTGAPTVSGPRGRIPREDSEPQWRIKSESERRQERAEEMRRNRERAESAAERGEMFATTLEDYNITAALVDDLARRRPGSKASEAAYLRLDQQRFAFRDVPEIAKFASQGLAAHRLAREVRGMEPRPPTTLAPDERPDWQED